MCAWNAAGRGALARELGAMAHAPTYPGSKGIFRAHMGFSGPTWDMRRPQGRRRCKLAGFRHNPLDFPLIIAALSHLSHIRGVASHFLEGLCRNPAKQKRALCQNPAK